MSRLPSLPDEFERLEHEIVGRLHRFDVDRRALLKILGGGVLICLAAPAASAQESGRSQEREIPQELGAWLHVDRDGLVTVFTGKVEVGQNIRTSLAQAVAEELRVPVASVRMIMGDTDRTPWDMGTFGSRTTPTMAPQLAAAAVTAREALMDRAAQRWKADRSKLSAGDGRVRDTASGRSASYGELTRGEDLAATVSAEAARTPASSWKVAGKAAPKVDGRDFVTGRHRYSSDWSLPGLLHGKVLRPPSFQATLVSVDSTAAEKIPGVRVVRDGDFVGVAAPDVTTAERALAALSPQWREVAGQPSNANLFEYLRTKAGPAEERQGGGSIETLASADVKTEATYSVEYIAHAPLEPRAAAAEWKDGKVTVWTGTQRPFAVREELARAFRIPVEKARVLVPDTGSAYGGKHTGDAAVEAARLSRAAGRPVKVVWTREEEFTWAYLRPAGVIDVRAGAARDGALVAWEFHNYNSGPAAIGTPYAVPNRSVRFHPVESPLRQGSYRGLAATANHFARESHMDEIAKAVGMDPLEFRRKNLTDPRLRAVLDAAAERFGWPGRKTSEGRGSGIACGVEKGGYVATCAEVEVDRSRRSVRIVRVVEAFECGAVVNPDGLRNQVEGAIVQGLGGALFEAIRFGNGRIENPHFAEYRLPRFPDVPPIEVVILDRRDLASAGAGETPIVGIAPALGNAIFEASGVRLRRLPLLPEGVLPAAPAAG